jgi:gamma-glutamyl:cysteine ligase YbdK (ATP-grasp superfamily)
MARLAPAASVFDDRFAAVEAQGLLLGSAGTHPFGLFERQHTMRHDRYRHLIDELQYAGRRELIYGPHRACRRRRR